LDNVNVIKLACQREPCFVCCAVPS